MLPIALFLAAITFNANDIAESRKLQQEAIAAYRAKDAATFLAKIQAASDLRPRHPSMLYMLAIADAMNGRNDDALAALERVAAMGFVYKPDTQAEFATLHDNPRYAAIVDRFRRNGERIGNPERASGLPDAGLIPEGLAYDAATGRIFVSSVRKNTIFVIDRSGKSRAFVANQPWSVFGMAVDAKRHLLWAATSAIAQSEHFVDADRDHAAIMKIDLRNGKVLATYRPADRNKHLFGDLAVGPRGEIYVSDSVSPVIFTLDGDTLKPFARDNFASLQGLAVSADGRTLYASDYSRGIVAIDTATRDARLIATPPEISLLGIDGLYLVDRRTFIATQNGTTPNRVVRIRLNATGDAVDRIETLAANTDPMTDITLGTRAGNAFLFNANAQWDLWDDDGKLTEGAKLQPLAILRIPKIW